MFEVGDYVINNKGEICSIKEEVKLDYSSDRNKLYFLLLPLKDRGGKIYIPVENADARLRKVMTQEEVQHLLEQIESIDELWSQNDKEREKIYKEAVRSCDPKLLVGIIKGLYDRRRKRVEEGKKNPAVDERYFKLAEENLYAEIGFVINKDVNEIQLLIRERME